MRQTKYPEYSVLMSIYYKENPLWFEESIESMINQTIKPKEFVLVKDGPLTNELEMVILSYVSKFPNLFKIISIEKNGGLGPALQIGVNNCTCEFIARMDSDDISESTRIERELDLFLEDEKLGMVGTNVIEFCGEISNEICQVVLPETHKEIVSFSKKRNPFRHPSILFKKEAILNAGNYRDYYLFEDYDMWIRMLRSGCKCYNIQDNLVYMRVSPDFYKRRGGIKYLRSVKRFLKEQRQIGYFSFNEYIRTLIPRTIVCLLPNFARDLIYRKMLRKKGKKKNG